MKKRIIASVFTVFTIFASLSTGVFAADTSAPTASSYSVYNLSGSQTSVIPVNHEGETWSNRSTVRAIINDVTDVSGVQGVKFYVKYTSYPYSNVQSEYNGQQIPNTTNWYADIPVSGDSVTIQAFPIDNLGNTLYNSMKGNISYQYTKSFQSDFNIPGGFTSIEPQGSYWIDAQDRYVTNAAQIKLKATVHDSDGAPWSSSSVKSVSFRLFKNGSNGFSGYSSTYISGNQNRSGDYVCTFNRSSLTAETSYKVVAVIIDYSGNSFYTTPKYFVTDTQCPQGIVSAPSNTVYGDSFDVYIDNVSEASYVDTVYFPTWTDANGQDDLVWYTGYRVGEKTWKITINRSNHKNEKGLYYTHVYTSDFFGNLGFAGGTYVVLQ